MDAAHHVVRSCLDPVVLLRAFYLAASALILLIQVIPALESRFLAYGSRAASPSSPAKAEEKEVSLASQLLDYLASLRVPHNYFTHFYVISVLSSLFWAWRMNVHGKSWDTLEQVHVAWLLMLLQGIRRLAESYAYTSTSKSSMWFGHWLLGLIFYLTINAAIWAEASVKPEVLSEPSQASASTHWRITVLPPAILACHALQHTYHAYLYRLRTSHSTYQLPSHPLFPNLLCPHYTCETLIYLLLSLLAVPAGQWVNRTILCASIFVAVNLGVTAHGTKKWYEQRFGVEKVRGRRRMVPWVW